MTIDNLENNLDLLNNSVIVTPFSYRNYLFKLRNNNKLSVFLLVSLIGSLISHYGTVSYYDFYQNFLLLLCFCAINRTEREGRNNKL